MPPPLGEGWEGNGARADGASGMRQGERTFYPNLKRAKIWAMGRMGWKGNKKKRDKKAEFFKVLKK